jgi:hypothetical protein
MRDYRRYRAHEDAFLRMAWSSNQYSVSDIAKQLDRSPDSVNNRARKELRLGAKVPKLEVKPLERGNGSWTTTMPFVAWPLYPSTYRRYQGEYPTCADCGAAIVAGETIRWARRQGSKRLVHVSCAKVAD